MDFRFTTRDAKHIDGVTIGGFGERRSFCKTTEPIQTAGQGLEGFGE